MTPFQKLFYKVSATRNALIHSFKHRRPGAETEAHMLERFLGYLGSDLDEAAGLADVVQTAGLRAKPETWNCDDVGPIRFVDLEAGTARTCVWTTTTPTAPGRYLCKTPLGHRVTFCHVTDPKFLPEAEMWFGPLPEPPKS